MAAPPTLLDVVCVVLSRAQAREEYRTQDYQVCAENVAVFDVMCVFRFVCWRETVFPREKCRRERNQRRLHYVSSVNAQD